MQRSNHNSTHIQSNKRSSAESKSPFARADVVRSELCNLVEKESLTYGNRLDSLEKQMQKAREEYANLKVLNKDAIVAKENAINEFAKFEDKVYRFAQLF